MRSTRRCVDSVHATVGPRILSIHLSIYSVRFCGFNGRIGLERPCLPTRTHVVGATRRVRPPCQGEGRGFESRRPLQSLQVIAPSGCRSSHSQVEIAAASWTLWTLVQHRKRARQLPAPSPRRGVDPVAQDAELNGDPPRREPLTSRGDVRTSRCGLRCSTRSALGAQCAPDLVCSAIHAESERGSTGSHVRNQARRR